jgi:anaerobic selenocysteine-containing dehydrogenase
MVIGANPTEGHPVTGARLKQQVMKGTPLIVIDPRKIELVPYATHHLQLRPGTNVALLNMIARYILDAGLVDPPGLRRRPAAKTGRSSRPDCAPRHRRNGAHHRGADRELARAAASNMPSR